CPFEAAAHPAALQIAGVVRLHLRIVRRDDIGIVAGAKRERFGKHRQFVARVDRPVHDPDREAAVVARRPEAYEQDAESGEKRRRARHRADYRESRTKPLYAASPSATLSGGVGT